MPPLARPVPFGATGLVQRNVSPCATPAVPDAGLSPSPRRPVPVTACAPGHELCCCSAACPGVAPGPGPPRPPTPPAQGPTRRVTAGLAVQPVWAASQQPPITPWWRLHLIGVAVAILLQQVNRLKGGCDPANAFESFEQDAHTLEDADILLPSSAGFKVVSHVSSITDWLNEELLSSAYHDEVFAVLSAEHIFLGGPHVSRREGSGSASEPLYHLHNDYTGNMKEAYMRALSGGEPNQSWTMEEMLAVSFVDGSDVPAQMEAVGFTAERLAERRM
eukprot:gene6355-1131_t